MHAVRLCHEWSKYDGHVNIKDLKAIQRWRESLPKTLDSSLFFIFLLVLPYLRLARSYPVVTGKEESGFPFEKATGTNTNDNNKDNEVSKAMKHSKLLCFWKHLMICITSEKSLSYAEMCEHFPCVFHKCTVPFSMNSLARSHLPRENCDKIETS